MYGFRNDTCNFTINVTLPQLSQIPPPTEPPDVHPFAGPPMDQDGIGLRQTAPSPARNLKITILCGSVRRDIGARNDLYQLIPGDDGRIIKTSDILRHGPGGRISHSYPSPADEYSKVLMPPEGLTDKLRKGVASPPPPPSSPLPPAQSATSSP